MGDDVRCRRVQILRRRGQIDQRKKQGAIL